MRNFQIITCVEAKELCVRDRIAYVSAGIVGADGIDTEFLSPHFFPIREVKKHMHGDEVLAVTVSIVVSGKVRTHKFKGDADVTVAADVIDVFAALQRIEAAIEPDTEEDDCDCMGGGK